MNNLGIYIHIPFCIKKCNYCDFLTIIGSDQPKIDEYVRYLCKEIILMKEYAQNKIVDTVYFGGGTPSLLSVNNINNIMNCINQHYNLSRDAEITIEINPETIDENWVKEISDSGINRASVGFQNSRQEILNIIGRRGSNEHFIACIKWLNMYNITNISADIILGLPLMDVDKTIDDANFICELNIPHISAYSLILENRTKLYKQVNNGEIVLPSEDLERDIYHKFCDYVKSKGYHRYEVSSFCKNGYESRHNKKYWDLSEYLGLGLGASGLINNNRTKNPVRISEYYKRLDDHNTSFDVEYELSKNDMMSEYSFLAIRTSRGIDKNYFKNKFNVKFDDVFNLKIHEKNKLIVNDNNFVRLTDKGFDLSNLVEIDLLL